MARKNSTHLWSDAKNNFEEQANIILDKDVLDEISAVSNFYNPLTHSARVFKEYAKTFPNLMQIILEEEADEPRDKDGNLKNPISNYIKKVINFKMFLYFATKLQKIDTKYHKVEEFDLGTINSVRDNNIELMNEHWDRSIVNKMNILFYDTLSVIDINAMAKTYFEEFPEELRMFELIETKDIFKKYDEDDIEEIEYTQRIIRIKEGQLLKYLDLTRTFNRILESPHPYGYKVTMKAFPTTSDKDKIVSWNTNIVSDRNTKAEKNAFVKKYTALELFGEELLAAKHDFPLTRKIIESEERKKNLPFSDIIINIEKSAESLDNKLIKNGYKKDATWQSSRIKHLEVRGIEYHGDSNCVKGFEKNINEVKISSCESLVGMLGAGKSTLSMLAINDLVDAGKIIAVLEKDVGSCIALIDTLRKIGVKSTLVKGERTDGGIKHLLDYCKNVSSKYNSLLDFNEAESENLKLLDTTSTVKKINEFAIESNIDSAAPEMIRLESIDGNNNSKRKNFVNPEYINSGIYHKYRELEDAQVIVLNYSSFLKTKAPFCLDVYERDFFTIISKIADVVIVDEVDMAMVRFTESYIGEMYIASTEPDRNKNKYFNDYLEVTRSQANKQRDIARNVFTRGYNKVQGNQVQIINELLPFPEIFSYKKILNKPFTKYSLTQNFYTRYFDIDDIQVYYNQTFRNFYDLFLKRQIDRKIKVVCEANKILINVFTEIHLGNMDIVADKELLAEHCAKFLKEFAKKENIKVKQEAYRVKIAPHESSEQEEFDTSKFTDTVYDDNYASNACLADFLFLILQSNLDINQRQLSREVFKYLQLINKEQDADEITGGVPLNKNKGIYPLLPKALIHDTASYRLNRSESRNIDLTMTEYSAMGNKVLLDYNQLFNGIENVPAPSMIMMSATSYTPHSTMYHNEYKPNYMIVNPNQLDMKITSKFIPIVYNNEVLYISGQKDKESKNLALARMVRELTIDNGLFDKQLQKHQEEYENLSKEEKKISKRRVISIPVPSFELAETIGRLINETKYAGRVKVLFTEGKKVNGKLIAKDDSYHITKELVEELYKDDFDIFVFVMTSIGRGYNILQSSKSYKSLIGSMFFLVRPYLVPDSLNDVIHTLHGNLSSIIRTVRKKYELNAEMPHSKIYNEVIGICHKLFDELITAGVGWDKLDNFERKAIVANFMVLIYQTIGRGVRGGTDIDVFFVDGKFVGEKTKEAILTNGVGENYEYEPLDSEYDSFLSIMESITDEDDLIVKELYSKLANSLKGIALKKEFEF